MLTKQFIQNYFHADYKGIHALLSDVLVPMFGDYDRGYTEITMTDTAMKMAKAANIQTIKHVATFQGLGYGINVFDVTLSDRCRIHQARKNIQALVRQYVEKFEGAFIVFHYAKTANRSWRFSYLEKRETNAKSTDAKRYTYLCGQQYPCRTLAERFEKLQYQDLTAVNLEAAFSVEALSDEFFAEYKNFYDDFVNFVINENHLLDEFLPLANGDPDKAKKLVRDYIKKLMGRLVFIQFLQNKAWLKEDIHYTHTLFDQCTESQKESFLDNVLKPLFFGIFNTQKDAREELFRREHWSMELLKEWMDFPYLNGGLFECDELDKLHLSIPSYFFSNPQNKDHVRKPSDKYYDDACGIFDFFDRYNFTIDESDPLDNEVGVDPEMLGKIFENLLEDNKDKGAFYTPKEIVNYMCREALVAYLVDEARTKSEVNKQRQENFEEAIRAFVADPEMTVQRIRLYGKQQLEDLNESLCNVKICDPAIGSGAFPMGLLNLLMTCRVALNNALGKGEPRAWLKKEIIKNNIYGVDIEKGAIDIARLRFWLSIVVDLEEPEALPNFDYKFMQGNSLLEQYNGVDLSQVAEIKKGNTNGYQISMFENELDVCRRKLHDKLEEYFGVTNHVTKQNLRNDISTLVQKELDEQHITVDLSDIDISANDKFFLWHTWFADVFNRSGKQGFDIVIGNPPYGAKLSATEKALYKQLYSEVHMRTPETFCYFTALAFRLCSQCGKGVVSYIVPNNIFFQNENEKTRELLSIKNMLLRAINLGDNTFENADVPTCIFVAKASKSNDYSIDYSDYRKYNVKQIEWDKQIDKINIQKLQTVPSLVLGLSNEDIDIFNYIRKNGVTIDSIAEEMASGISTGDNNAFILTEHEQEINKLEPTLLKRILIGSDIDCYLLQSTSNLIIYTTRDIDIHDYPKTESYLNNFYEKLNNRSESKKGILPWFALGRSRYEGLFIEPKIIMRQTSDRVRCVYDSDGYFVLNSILVFKKNTKEYSYKYIASMLNSKIANYIYRNLTQEEGRTFAEVKPANVRKLYIPKATIQEQELLSSLYDYMVYLRDAKSPAVDSIISNKFIGDYFERIIDGCAYELFFREHMKERGIDIMDDLYNFIIPIDNANNTPSIISSVFNAIYKTDNNIRTRLELFVSRSPEYLKVIIQS